MDLREAASGVVPDEHWYYRTKKLPLLDYFKSTPPETVNIVDVGAGSGYFSERLIAEGGRSLRSVTRVDSEYPSEETNGIVRLARELPSEIRSSMIVMMDVLEHVKDDAGFLKSITGRSRGRNHVFITVPAFMSLWSPHDAFLGHHRRYTLPEIERLAKGAGIEITSGYYIYGLIFPAVWLARRLNSGGQGSDLKPASKLASAVLEGLCRLEFVFRRCNRLLGVTCVIEGVTVSASTPAATARP